MKLYKGSLIMPSSAVRTKSVGMEGGPRSGGRSLRYGIVLMNFAIACSPSVISDASSLSEGALRLCKMTNTCFRTGFIINLSASLLQSEASFLFTVFKDTYGGLQVSAASGGGTFRL